MKINFIGASVLLAFFTCISFFGYNFYLDHFVEINFGLEKGLSTSAKRAGGATGGLPTAMVQFIADCKLFPENVQDFVERTWDYQSIFREGQPSPRDGIKKCDRTPFKIYEKEVKDTSRPELATPHWIDPWGRPYQIRYDLDRGKLQVRSQGRYLWTELDDIVGETPFVTKDYPKDGMPLYVEMLEHCKKVPKDDLTCIYNRGWH